MALDLADRTLALHLGLAALPAHLSVTYVPQATGQRHERMLDSLSWDVCEFSLATYLSVRERGWPATALPIFPRRMFAIPLIYVRAGSGITEPAQLAGRRIGIRSFTTTLCLWGIGDLASIYGVRLADVTWYTERADPFCLPKTATWRVERLAKGRSVEMALAKGDLDAILVPRVPGEVGAGAVVPLMSDPLEAMRQYYSATGVFPIMHTIVVRDEVVARRPELPAQLLAAFEEAKRVGYLFYRDPNWCMLPGATSALDSDREWLGDDPYPYGLEQNIPALERLMGYARDLGVVETSPTVESLFVKP